jgi:hypothetical protein
MGMDVVPRHIKKKVAICKTPGTRKEFQEEKGTEVKIPAYKQCERKSGSRHIHIKDAFDRKIIYTYAYIHMYV